MTIKEYLSKEEAPQLTMEAVDVVSGIPTGTHNLIILDSKVFDNLKVNGNDVRCAVVGVIEEPDESGERDLTPYNVSYNGLARGLRLTRAKKMTEAIMKKTIFNVTVSEEERINPSPAYGQNPKYTTKVYTLNGIKVYEA